MLIELIADQFEDVSGATALLDHFDVPVRPKSVKWR